LSAIRLVLAEDQSMVLGAFASLLELEADVDVVATATDGDQALAAVELHAPDVLLTDIEMPRRTGLEVAAELHRRGTPTRVLIVTTFARSGYLRRALDAGVSGYVLKDAPIDELVAAVRQVHAGQRVIAPELAVAAWGDADPLTERERDVLKLAADGLANAAIARAAPPRRGDRPQLPVRGDGQAPGRQPDGRRQPRPGPGLAVSPR
jgi:two-component system, NarL family, response regulator DesR